MILSSSKESLYTLSYWHHQNEKEIASTAHKNILFWPQVQHIHVLVGLLAVTSDSLQAHVFYSTSNSESRSHAVDLKIKYLNPTKSNSDSRQIPLKYQKFQYKTTQYLITGTYNTKHAHIYCE